MQAEADEKAKVDPKERQRDWWFNFFANMAGKKSTRKGFGAALEAAAGAMAEMPAYESKIEEIDRKQDNLRREREMNMARMEIAMTQNNAQLAAKINEANASLNLQSQQLGVQRDTAVARLALLEKQLDNQEKTLGVRTRTLALKVAQEIREAKQEFPMTQEGMAARKRFAEMYDEDSPQFANAMANAAADYAHRNISLELGSSLSGAGDTSVVDESDL